MGCGQSPPTRNSDLVRMNHLTESSWTKSPIVVTGGAGFIGSNFVLDWLEDAGSSAPLVNVDCLTYAGNLKNLESVSGDPQYTFVRADICDQVRMKALLEEFNPRAIVHFAAESHVDRSILGPDAFVGRMCAEPLYCWRRRGPIGTICRSRSGQDFDFCMFPPTRCMVRWGQTIPRSAKRRLIPEQPLSATKAASDHLVRAYFHTYGLPTMITNCSNNYGPHHFPEKLIPLIIRMRWRVSRCRSMVMGRMCATGCMCVTIAMRLRWCWQRGGPEKLITLADRNERGTAKSWGRSARFWMSCGGSSRIARTGKLIRL